MGDNSSEKKTDLLSVVERKKMQAPNKGWRYIQPESGMRFHALVWDSMVDQVYKHRLANGYDVAEGWQERFEDEICRAMGIEVSHCGQDPPTPADVDYTTHSRIIGWREVVNFGKAVAAWISTGMTMVEQEEADRRASICIDCPMNGHTSCGACMGMGKVAEIVGDRVSKHNDRLQGCKVCGCTLALKIWCSSKVLIASHDKRFKYPPTCWMADFPEVETVPPRKQTITN